MRNAGLEEAQAGIMGRVEVRGGEGTGRRKSGRSKGAGGRAGEEAEGRSAAAEAPGHHCKHLSQRMPLLPTSVSSVRQRKLLSP